VVSQRLLVIGPRSELADCAREFSWRTIFLVHEAEGVAPSCWSIHTSGLSFLAVAPEHTNRLDLWKCSQMRDWLRTLWAGNSTAPDIIAHGRNLSTQVSTFSHALRDKKEGYPALHRRVTDQAYLCLLGHPRLPDRADQGG
jgi:hypothetical protein